MTLRITMVLCLLTSIAGAESMARYNVVWDSPSKDETGQMPLGNGDIAASVCAIEDGDLYLLLAKNDAFTYNGDIFKTGRVRISLSPNPFAKGKKFRQTLDLDTGSVRINADCVSVRIWADANRAVYHVEIDSPGEITVTAEPALWKRIDGCKYNVSKAPIKNPTQDVRIERDGNILWYFAVGDRSTYNEDLKYYDVAHMTAKYPDPYRFNTFGNLLESPDLKLVDGVLKGGGRRFDIRIHALTKQTPKVLDWIETIQRHAAKPIDAKKDFAAHCKWWKAFWARSWIIASDNTLPAEQREKLNGEAPSGKRTEKDGGAIVAQSYNVFRYIMACQSRGRIQAKFNGGLFTQPLRGRKMLYGDDRDWGRRYTYQNQRLLYWPLLMSGDGDLMQPFFDYYWNLLPIRKAITKAWFGHDGAYYRENIEPSGGERDCGRSGKPPKTKPGENKGKGYYHSYYFTCGLETVTMMIEYVKYSGDTKFRDDVLVPFAREVLLFFDKHYQRDAAGKIRLDPAMVLETWWIAVNPAPDVAGLQFCLDELLAMKAGRPGDQKSWRRFRAEIPPIHLHDIGGRKAIAPALKWSGRHNAENGLLYPVFPFRCFGLGLGTKDIVDWTMQHRTNKNAFGYKCWTQDQIHWAYAGNAAEAADGLIHRFRNASTQCRFPLYGSARPDSCPDLDHFGAGSTALQRMIAQEANGKILLLPAWPANWDASFKLHLEKNTIISGTVIAGKLTDWTVTPASRKKDVVVYKPQTAPKRLTGATGGLVLPVNKLPLRIGANQSGGNRFAGKIGRVTIFRGLLKPEAIGALAAGNRRKNVATDSVISCALNPKSGMVPLLKTSELKLPISFEAWIMPAKGDSGRIIDKLTGGKRDGFLIDTWPGQCLRVITGAHQFDFPHVLKAGVWQHIAVVIDKNKLEAYVNGKKR
jgi:alpha-L-fucosidase 2